MEQTGLRQNDDIDTRDVPPVAARIRTKLYNARPTGLDLLHRALDAANPPA